MSDDYKPVLRPGSDPVAFFRTPGQGAAGPARGHIMAAVIARALRDREVAVVGANPLIPIAGARLAQLTHAPNLTVIAGASGGVNPLLDPLAPSSGDYANLVAEAVLPFEDVLALQGSGLIDVFFAGGLQIDRRGNCNLAAAGPLERPVLRGPGSAGLPLASRSRRVILYTTSHTTRLFVPQVDFVSLPGWPVDPESGARKGPEMVVTPLAVLDFAPDANGRLRSVHPGVTVDEVVANTGFALAMPAGEAPVTQPPGEVELEHMRSFDIDGLLAIVA